MKASDMVMWAVVGFVVLTIIKRRTTPHPTYDNTARLAAGLPPLV